MKKLVLLFLVLGLPAWAQQVYQPNEVDTQAAPAGEADVFSLFLSSNLQVPIKSGWKGLNGRVFVKAVVETDGSASGFQVIRGIDTLCNREALRVLSLYKAWRPALLKNVPVRQEIAISVPFRSAPVTAYDSVTSSLVTHFDKKWITVSDPDVYYYKRSIPVDELGFMNGNIVYLKRNGNTWDDLISVPLIKTEFWKKLTVAGKEDSVKAVRISAAVEGWNRPIYQMVEMQENGNILLYNQFTEDGKLTVSKSYNSNGVLRDLETRNADIVGEISWYENGQLASIVKRPAQELRPFVYTMNEFYDRDGNHRVAKGNGYFGPGNYQRHGFEGHGSVKNGLKEGLWISKSKDSTLLFEEYYENGKLTKGTSYSDGQKLEYTEEEVQPEFDGGIPEMYRYLAKNIKYPMDAAKSNIQGRVFTSFVVCQDGTLCDFEVIKGVYKSMDKEALRVIEGMSGKWKPGWQRGKRVRVKYNLPINFQLE